jgi:hypothetical protein
MDFFEESIIQSGEKIEVLKLVIKRAVRMYGLKNLLLKVGDYAVKVTKNETDDKVWREAKKHIKGL